MGSVRRVQVGRFMFELRAISGRDGYPLIIKRGRQSTQYIPDGPFCRAVRAMAAELAAARRKLERRERRRAS